MFVTVRFNAQFFHSVDYSFDILHHPGFFMWVSSHDLTPGLQKDKKNMTQNQNHLTLSYDCVE